MFGSIQSHKSQRSCGNLNKICTNSVREGERARERQRERQRVRKEAAIRRYDDVWVRPGVAVVGLGASGDLVRQQGDR